MNKNEEFRKLFKELETLMDENKIIKEKSIISKEIGANEKIDILKNDKVEPYYSNYNFLKFCNNCRNKIVHGIDGDIYVEYNDDLLSDFQTVIYQIKNPAKAYDKSTKNIMSASLNDNVRDIMEIMKKNNYTHIPIYDEKGLVGIFSESSIFNYLYDEEIIEIAKNSKFSDILNYIEIKNSFNEVKFVKRNEPYNNIIKTFYDEFKKGQKLSCIMVTQNGKIGEKVIGIITSWDILGRD